MLLFHGLAGFGGIGGGAKGVGILGAGYRITFQQMAEKYKYIVVAPDSRTASLAGWIISTAKQLPTPDILHAKACMDWVMQLPGVKIDPRYVATAGVSNGGLMAGPVASRYKIFTHAMMFHADFTMNQLTSTHPVKMWMSTGLRDMDYTPTHIRRLANLFRLVFKDWPAIVVQVQYFVGHTLQDPLERIDALNWWLGRGPWTARTSVAQLIAWSKVDPVFRMMTPNRTYFEIDDSYMAVATPTP